MAHDIKELLTGKIAVDQNVHFSGWVRTRRDSKAGISFLQISDGSCFDPIQVVVPADLSNYESEVKKLTTGCSVSVSGQLVASQGKGQSFEVQAIAIDVLGWVENPETYPMSPKHHSLEHLREYPHLRPRTNTIGAMTRIKSVMMRAIHEYFANEGFYWVATPIITALDCEGAGELFRVSTLDLMNLPRKENGHVDFTRDFFGKETYLTVSGQLNVESYCQALSKVYTFGPTFRAENSNTSRHLAEFWMVEPEIAFADLNDVIMLSDGLLKYVFQYVLDHCEDDMAFFEERIDKTCIERLRRVIDRSITLLDYTDAITELKKSGKTFEYPVDWELGLQTEHERYLAEEMIGGPVAVTNYPKDIKAFYMRVNDDNKTVAAMDVLVPHIGEIIGGSQREERLLVAKERLTACNLDHDQYAWYLDLRRYGTVPHGGFGLGFERLVSYVTGLHNIRDVIAFPRTPKDAAL